MASRRKSHPALTLFAFQDIIMSVSGIIIMVVLVLTLELIQRPEQEAVSAHVVEQLRAEIENVTSAISDLEQLVAATDQRIQDSALLSEAEMSRNTRLTEADNAQLEQDVAALQVQVEDLQERERAVRIEGLRHRDIQSEIDSARQKAKSLALELERQDNRPLFSLPRGFNKQGWIAVVSATEIAVAPLDRATRPRVFTGRGGLFGSSAASGFLEWAGSQPASQLYFLLMVRPDGTEQFHKVSAGLDARLITYGFDLAPAGLVLLDPERGAAE